MLPDLRIVIAAVLSTFILTVGVGFFASSRLIHDQMASRLDSRSDDTPINRIALNWPEPTATESRANLDFAVSARASRNPVRDVAPATGGDADSTAGAAAPAITQGHAASPPSPEPAAQAPEPPAIIADAPDTVTAAPEETPSPATEVVAETTEAEAAPREEPAQAPDARVTVYPDQPATVEATGSIAAAPPATPADTASEPQPKMAAHTETQTEMNETPPAAATHPVVTQQKAAPLARKKRPRRAAARHHRQPAPSRPAIQAPQGFDFFGLFRNPPAALRLPPQTQAPASPAS